MGTDDPRSFPNERPAHQVKVDGFWMDQRDVSNDEFKKFVDATGYVTTAERKPDWEELKKQLPPDTPKPDDSVLVPGSMVFVSTTNAVDLRDISQWWRWTPGASWRHPGGPGTDIKGKSHYPVVQVSWDDAVAYAKWAGKRLPTEAEWEYSARGGLDTLFPWGNQPVDRTRANFSGSGLGTTSPVGMYPAGYGLFDMAGNVWEFLADEWQPYSSTPQKDPVAGGDLFLDGMAYLGVKTRRVIRGGSFAGDPVNYWVEYRDSHPADGAREFVGFRCAK
jgi:formylglycine-generating enzyme required for sulfatase activity